MKKILSLLLVTIAYNVQAQQQFTFKLFDLNTGKTAHSSPHGFTKLGNRFVFNAFTDEHGKELWVSDGTTAGTAMLKDIYEGRNNADPHSFISYNGKIIFSVMNANGTELWMTDGTASGTQMIKVIYPGKNASVQLVEYNGKLYFNGNDGINGFELWVTDGTSSGTQMIKDINPGVYGSNVRELTVCNGKLFFSANDGTNGSELWVSDGTATGTILLKDIETGSGNSNPNAIKAIDNTLYFTAYTSTQGYEVWTSDGTAAGTQILKDINPSTGNSVRQFNSEKYAFNNKIYFAANDGTNGEELWVTDGTTSGTQLLKDINPNAQTDPPNNFFEYNNKLYFTANDGTTGGELWVTDGTTNGTVLFKDLNPGSAHGNPTNYIVFKNNLYFTGMNYSQLFVTDGTVSGTNAIATPHPDSFGMSALSTFFIYDQDSALYFAAFFTSDGLELWRMKEGDAPTNINTITSNNFNIYPNPNNGTFTLTLDNNHFTTGSISVYNALGRKVHEQNLTDKTQTIRLQQPAGNYWVKLQLDDAVLTKQVVLE